MLSTRFTSSFSLSPSDSWPRIQIHSYYTWFTLFYLPHTDMTFRSKHTTHTQTNTQWESQNMQRWGTAGAETWQMRWSWSVWVAISTLQSELWLLCSHLLRFLDCRFLLALCSHWVKLRSFRCILWCEQKWRLQCEWKGRTEMHLMCSKQLRLERNISRVSIYCQVDLKGFENNKR